MKWSRKFGAVLLWAVLLTGRAEGHSFIVELERNTVAIGETSEVWVTLSEPFATPDLSLYGYGAEIEAQRVYASGKKEPITGFSFFNSKNPSDADPAHSDVQKASFSISEGGTVLVSAKMTMRMPKEVVPSQPYLVSFAKNAVNLAADDAAKKPVGGNDVLEIVPMQNLNGLTAEKPFMVQVLFKGKPLPGATVSAVYDGMPIDAETGEQAYSLQVTADEKGVASVTPDRAAFWLLNAGHETLENTDTPYQYQATLVVPVNGKEGETERIVSDMLMPAEDNQAGLNFAEFVEGQLPEADAFIAEKGLRWSAYLATGRGSSAFYEKGGNQLDGKSGVAFTVPVTGSGAFTGFSSVYVFTPKNLGESVYKALTDELNARPAVESPNGKMVVASPKDLFPKLGLSIFQIYQDQDENTRRDVTDVMIDIGFEISKMGEGEITAWWGVLVADRDVSDAGSYLPIVLSSIDESGHILFDGKGDGRIDGTFYIARKSGDSSGGSGNGGGGCGIGLGALAFLACLWILRRKH